MKEHGLRIIPTPRDANNILEKESTSFRLQDDNNMIILKEQRRKLKNNAPKPQIKLDELKMLTRDDLDHDISSWLLK